MGVSGENKIICDKTENPKADLGISLGKTFLVFGSLRYKECLLKLARVFFFFFFFTIFNTHIIFLSSSCESVCAYLVFDA